MDRRVFIKKCGLGLAGIIAAEKAPAAVVRSMLGVRGISQQQTQDSPSSADYVQDGLIGMWDGIENIGYGQHDDNATIWIDLSNNGRDATLTGTYSWGENYWQVLSYSGNGLAKWDGRNLGTSQTIEFVIECLKSHQYGRIIAEGQGIASPIRYFSNLYLFDFGIDTNGPYIAGLDKGCHKHTITHQGGGDMCYYVDGILRWTRTLTYNSTGSTYAYFGNRANKDRGLDAKYYTMRRYDRVLTEQEIAHNYSIDKERFGL